MVNNEQKGSGWTFILVREWLKDNQHRLFWSACAVLVCIISYNLGRIRALEKTAISVTDNKANIFNAVQNSSPPAQQGVKSASNPVPLDTRVVVSKNSDKYHFSWCSGAKRINPENQIWFNTASEAEASGYTLAGNCQ